MEVQDKFDFNTLPEFWSTDNIPVSKNVELLYENGRLKSRIKELEERILSLELDLDRANEELWGPE